MNLYAQKSSKTVLPLPSYTKVELKFSQSRTFFLIEDHSLMRYGIAGYLSEKCSFKCAGFSRTVQDFFNYMEEIKLDGATDAVPNFLVTEFCMGGKSGVDISMIKKCRKLYPQIKIIIYTEQKCPFVVNVAIEAGAKGYVTKQSDERELKNAIDSVLAGKIYVEPNLAKSLVAFEHSLSRFTKRESEILCLIMQNCSNSEIAKRLSLTKRTVENNISHIYTKTGLYSSEELVNYEYELGKATA